MEIIRVGKTRYNQILQDIQTDVVSFGFETRMETRRDDHGKIKRAEYQVHWDGRWHTLATEVPFVGEDNDGTIYEDRWTDIKFRAVRELVTS